MFDIFALIERARDAACAMDISSASCPTPWFAEILTSANVMLFGSTLLGAVVGSLVAGLIQYRISAKELSADEATRKAARQDVEKAQALAVTVKMQQILNGIRDLERSISQSIAEGEEKGLALWPTCLKVRPVSGLPINPPAFTPDEMAVFLAAKKIDLSNKLFLLASRWSAAIEIMRDYNRTREELRHIPEIFHAATGKGLEWASVDDQIKYEGRIRAASDFIEDIHGSLIADIEAGDAIATEVGEAFKSYFDDSAFPSLKARLE